MWALRGVLSLPVALSTIKAPNSCRLLSSQLIFSRGLKKRADNWGSKKQRRKLIEQLEAQIANKADPKIEAKLAPLRDAVKLQADEVRKLKEAGLPETEWKNALDRLKLLKKELEEKQLELVTPLESDSFDRSKLEELLKQRFFFHQAFSVYGGVQGLYDFGPTGCAVKANLLAAWRQFFVNEDHMLEIEGSMLTPEAVLKASGHVERFADWMVKDVKTGECFRADHLLTAALEKQQFSKTCSDQLKQEITRLLPTVDNMTAEELQANLVKFGVRSAAGNDLSEPQRFNLMFSTSIGPAGNTKGYLRPETAQGVFVNFSKLLDFNHGRMPFAAAQIGYSFRNEISPRSAILRVREFCMAEIEHFVDPLDKSHPKFDRVADYRVPLYTAHAQMNGQAVTDWRIADAVDQKLLANQTLAYYLARVHQFLVKVGMDASRLRFRQHLANEMSHYAADCWDAECHTSYGWVEAVGCADRSCFDLTQHSKASGSRLTAERPLSSPKQLQWLECVPCKSSISQTFNRHAKLILERLATLDQDAVAALRDAVDAGSAFSFGSQSFTLTKEHVQFRLVEKKLFVEQYVPHVIEPSFGIGRIMYSLFEHNFRVRHGDEQRTYLALPAAIAPYKCSVLPLSSNSAFSSQVRRVSDLLTAVSVSHRIDDSAGSIGRRYARTDQIAIPFAITVDFDTLKAGETFDTVTLRERDSMRQVRAPVNKVVNAVADLCANRVSWSDVEASLPVFLQQEASSKDSAA